MGKRDNLQVGASTFMMRSIVNSLTMTSNLLLPSGSILGTRIALRVILLMIVLILYYGYAWCVGEYQETDCYEYYYGSDDWVWNDESSYTWCINFYSDDECAERYLTSSGGGGIGGESTGSVLLIVVAILGISGTLGWVIWKKYNCFMSKPYSRLDARDKGGEDEVELL
eukprot:TRINITY_DN9895_c0_g1_i1.p1 TRINITY_DN9895_c0_g1~~TRINITY_DN9895_c0_g1_i1.p1  ORF type:complete len:169 (-),score=12.73 TRINITY_DN9895_c0_g1_i1:118-624(-)